MAANPIAYPLVNGVRHSFSSIELKLNGDIFTGFKSINYSWKVSSAYARGNHPDPMGHTRGEADYSADAELYLAEYNQFLSKVGNGLAVINVPIIVSYIENGFDTIVDELIGCKIVTGDASNSQGSDPTVRKIEFKPLKIKPNGLEIWDVPLKGVSV